MTCIVSDEKELYERFAHGDLRAFEVLFSRHQKEIFGWVWRIVRDRSEAEDLTVETFWRIWVARARFDESRSFGAWARRIATNVALNRLRTLRSTEPLHAEPPAPRLSDPVEQQDLREQIGAAFAGLSPKLRLVATLALVEGLPYDEIASSLGLSREAVKSRVFRASRQLRKALAAKGIRP